MTRDLHHCLRVVDHHIRDAGEDAVERRLDRGAVEVEGNFRRHHEAQVVALALDFDTGALERGAQLAFLIVHVGANAGTDDTACQRAAECIAAPVAFFSRYGPNQPADGRANGTTATGVGERCLPRRGVGRNTAGQEEGKACGAQ